MKLLSSLRDRIFLASALVAVLAVAFAFRYVTTRVAREAEAELRRELTEAGDLVARSHAAHAETLNLVARLVADLPPLKAAIETHDPPTVQPIAADYRARAQADYLAVTDRSGRVLAVLDGDAEGSDERPQQAAVRSALAGREAHTFTRGSRGLLQVISVPVTIDSSAPEVLGSLSLGFALNDALAGQFKALTHSEVAFAFDGELVASTLPSLDAAAVQRVAGSSAPVLLELGDEEYVGVSRPLAGQDALRAAPSALILRSRTARLTFVRAFRTGLLAAALLAMAVATLFAYGVARTVTQPLNALTAVMREVAATGDLTRKIRLSRAWYDEDARLLAHTFNTLTDSIARFQQEAALKDRLSALGRLSTVVAHEIRNPLMIIKASLRSLRSETTSGEDVREAAADIDHEVARLNRTVEDVLDFARPVRVERHATDLNALCREVVAATAKGDAAPPCRLELDPALPALLTDAERLRTVLVNILSNARQAVQDRAPRPEAGGVTLRTQARAGGGAVVSVEDDGDGINPADLPHIFDPYFTTRRTGTGLGLAIAKNIVDSLGGRLRAHSEPARGTRIVLDLPGAAPAAPAPETH